MLSFVFQADLFIFDVEADFRKKLLVVCEEFSLCCAVF
jgi:hypothetical protein